MSTTNFRRAYANHRSNAKRRGIGWELTFDLWLAIWTKSGHLYERGTKAGGYVMARFGDKGPYSEGNVFICSHVQNVQDGFVNRGTRSRRLGTGRGWTHRASRKTNPYHVMCAGKPVGTYQTQEAAEAAYAAAVERVRMAGPTRLPR